jgi:kynureninase
VAQTVLLEEWLLVQDLPQARFQVIHVPSERRGGFLAVQSSLAADLVKRLRTMGVWCDSRGEILRLGPAPYVTEPQLRDAAAAVGDAVRSL